MQWAGMGINALVSNIQSFTKTLDYDILLEKDGHDKSVLLLEMKPFKLPPAIPLQLGDVVHSLRASLDYLANALCVMHDPTKAGNKHIYFPFGQDKANLESRVAEMVRNQGLSPGVAQIIIDEVKPWDLPEGSGNTPLWSLNRLDQADKHRLLLPTASVGKLTGLNLIVQSEKGEIVMEDCRVTLKPLPSHNPDRKRYELRAALIHGEDCKIEITNKGSPMYDVVFDGYLFRDQSVTRVLHDLLDQTFAVYKRLFEHT
jgi:hypothetical protein